MNAISIFSSFPTEENRQAFIEKMKSEVLSGVYEPLQCELMLKMVEDTISEIRKDKEIKDAVLNHADKWSEKTFEYRGFSITKSQRSTFDYSACNDEVLNDLISQEEKLKEAIKKRQTVLQNTNLNDFADIQTGQILNPPVKTVNSYLTIKKAK